VSLCTNFFFLLRLFFSPLFREKKRKKKKINTVTLSIFLRCLPIPICFLFGEDTRVFYFIFVFHSFNSIFLSTRLSINFSDDTYEDNFHPPKRKRKMYLPPRKRVPTSKFATTDVMDKQQFLVTSICGFMLGIVFVPYALYVRTQRRARLSDEALENTRKGKRVVIVGGGAAGCTLASALTHRDRWIHVTIIEPSKRSALNTYLPAAHVGEVSFDLRCRGPDIYRGPTSWNAIRDARLVVDHVDRIVPEKNHVVCASGMVIPYEGLVVACGAIPDFSGVEGLSEETVDRGKVCYLPFATRDRLAMTYTGTILLAKMHTDAALKRPFEGFFISLTNKLYDYLKDFRKNKTMQLICATPDASPSDVFPRELVAPIVELWRCRKTDVRYRRKLISVKDDAATFVHLDTGVSESIPYSILVVDPPMKAPLLISRSGLDGPESSGFVDVDPTTLQHRKYENIFALGDCAALPTARSYGAVFAQVPYVANNLDAVLKQQERKNSSASTHHHDPNSASSSPEEAVEAPAPLALYPGYSSFYVSTGRNRSIWPEMKYPNPSDPWNNSYFKPPLRPSSSSSLLRADSQSADSSWSLDSRRLARADEGYFKNSDTSGLVSFLCGLYVESSLNAVMHFFLFLRGEWSASHWFDAPT
jgi:NADH dehydrogenase FAD-containing subunit